MAENDTACMIWVFLKIGGFPPKWMVYNGINPIRIDDLGVPLFLETPIWWYDLNKSMSPCFNLVNPSVLQTQTQHLNQLIDKLQIDTHVIVGKHWPQPPHCWNTVLIACWWSFYLSKMLLMPIFVTPKFQKSHVRRETQETNLTRKMLGWYRTLFCCTCSTGSTPCPVAKTLDTTSSHNPLNRPKDFHSTALFKIIWPSLENIKL